MDKRNMNVSFCCIFKSMTSIKAAELCCEHLYVKELFQKYPYMSTVILCVNSHNTQLCSFKYALTPLISISAENQ